MKNLMTPAALALIAGLTLVGCSDTNSSTNAPQSDAHSDHDHDHAGHDHDHDHADREPDTYTGIRGEITKLPDPAVPKSAFMIRHEQIRDFKTADGHVNVTADGIAGMKSMTMPFPLAEGVTLDGYSVGDKVEFDFVVNWGGGAAAWEITRLEKLPADTELDYTNVVEEDAESMQDAAHDMMDHDHDHGDDGP